MDRSVLRMLASIATTMTGVAAAMAACNGGATCTAPLASCGVACTDLQSDPANCGACGHACDTEHAEVCSQGTCALTCGGGTTKCGASCVDTAVDPRNCGGCGAACAAGESCTAGACGVACASSLTRCGGVCVDTQSDSANCGACGTACAANESCAAGACAPNLVDTGPSDIMGNVRYCQTTTSYVAHEAAMSDGRLLAVGTICNPANAGVLPGTAYVVSSSNGGLTWQTPVPLAIPNVMQLTVAAAHGPGATFYAAAVVDTGDLYFTTSLDGGATWSSPAIIDTNLTGFAGLRVDSYKGAVYVSAKEKNASVIHVLRSVGGGDAGVDGGATFALTTFTVGYPAGAVMVDQTNGDVWFATYSGELVRSTDGAATFGASQSVPLAGFQTDWDLANGTILGASWVGSPAGNVYAIPVPSLATPTAVSGAFTSDPDVFALAAAPSGDVFVETSVSPKTLQLTKVPFGIGTAIDDAGVISDAGQDGGAPLTTVPIVAQAAVGLQVATRTKQAVLYAYTAGDWRVFAGVKTF